MLKERILEIYKGSKNRYGAPKIHKQLKGPGIKISLKRTQRLMKSLGIKSIIIKKFRPASSKSKVESRENVLKHDFPTDTIKKSGLQT